MRSNVTTGGRAALAVQAAILAACVLVDYNAFADEHLRNGSVKFRDLNVETIAGVEVLYGRIHLAAHRVCSEADRMQQARASACAGNAEAKAIGALNLPLLTAYYRKKTGGRTPVLNAKR